MCAADEPSGVILARSQLLGVLIGRLIVTNRTYEPNLRSFTILPGLQVNERTLRRAWALGTLRGTRTTPYRLELQVDERVYLRHHWPTLSQLRRALRTEPNVSLAIVLGRRLGCICQRCQGPRAHSC
jgi:hypothetical protein